MKKRMGKAAALLVAVTMVCGMLPGCGSNGSEKAPETAKAQTEAGVAESGEAREGGGTIVATGTPEEIVACKDSYTGKYLKKYLDTDKR